MGSLNFFAQFKKAAVRGAITGLVLGGIFTLTALTNDYVIAPDELTVVSYPSESTGPESSEIAVFEKLEVETPRLAFNLRNELGQRR